VIFSTNCYILTVYSFQCFVCYNFFSSVLAWQIVYMQIYAASLHSDGQWRSSWCSNVAPMGPASTTFTPQAAMATSILRSRGGRMAMPTVRGGFSGFQQPWEPRGVCHLQGAQMMGSLSIVRWFQKIRMRR
jgi:hypothetical protein